MEYIKVKGDGVLSLGAQAKSGFCFLKQGRAYLSTVNGDLSDAESLKVFENRIKSVQRKLKIKLKVIACDLHSEYISTKLANDWVKRNGLRVKPIQHHEAHVASCVADNNIKGKIIGIAFDGTGLGSDGNIWGGEFFVGTLRGLKRVAHLKYIPMPGGEAAVREPWRMALSYLYNIYGRKVNLTGLDKEKARLIIQMIDKGINSPLTSSMGRLFDAVSALAGVCKVAEYEGQAAIELEKTIKPQATSHKPQDKYDFEFKEQKGIILIDGSPVIKGVVKDLKAKKSKTEISKKFHNAVCYMIRDICEAIREKCKINKVCMSGGVFQNKYVATHAKSLLEKENFKVYLHKNLPAHDGNIALGQAVLAGV